MIRQKDMPSEAAPALPSTVGAWTPTLLLQCAQATLDLQAAAIIFPDPPAALLLLLSLAAWHHKEGDGVN